MCCYNFFNWKLKIPKNYYSFYIWATGKPVQLLSFSRKAWWVDYKIIVEEYSTLYPPTALVWKTIPDCMVKKA